MMLWLLWALLQAGLLESAAVHRARQDAGIIGGQSIPSTAPPDGQFSNGAPLLGGMPPEVGDPAPDIYNAKDIDIPFYRLYHGNISLFPAGQLNTQDQYTDQWGSQYDSAKQSACGIPDNAFWISKVAIHPYFLKYADLSRYCMQDVCISFWREDGSQDMMLKVTDICSTDPGDPTHCATPGDIKIDRTKAKIWLNMGTQDTASTPEVQGDTIPQKTYWFFVKCWADGIAQPAYQSGVNNWFTNPPLPNNLAWAQSQSMTQYRNNQASYAARGWPTYPNGGYNPQRDETTSPPVSDWDSSQQPAWQPIAGGQGFGLPVPAADASVVQPAQSGTVETS